MAQNSYDKIISDAVKTAAGYYPEQSQQEYWHNSWLYRLFHPGEVQEKEFGQQIALQNSQNQWNSEQARMDRMKAAGINPNTAAAGIAGQGQSPSVSAPPTAVGAEANTLKTLADFGASVASMGSGVGAFAKLSPEIRLIGSEISKNLEDAGLSHWSAKSIETLLPSMSANQVADFYLKLHQMPKLRQEYLNLKKEYNNIIARYDEILANTSQMYSQADLNDALAGKADADAKYTNKLNEFWNRHHFMPNYPPDIALMDAMVDGSAIDVERIGQSISDYNDRVYDSQQSAIEEHAYAISSANSLGQVMAEWIKPGTNAWNAIDKLVYRLKNDSKFRNSDGNIDMFAACKDDEALKSSYRELESNLRAQVSDARREYKDAKHSGMNTQEVARLYNRYKSLRDTLDALDYDTYIELCLKNFGQFSLDE